MSSSETMTFSSFTDPFCGIEYSEWVTQFYNDYRSYFPQLLLLKALISFQLKSQRQSLCSVNTYFNLSLIIFGKYDGRVSQKIVIRFNRILAKPNASRHRDVINEIQSTLEPGSNPVKGKACTALMISQFYNKAFREWKEQSRMKVRDPAEH